MKYIDAELLREKIAEQMESLPREVGRGAGTITSKGYGMMQAFQIMRSIIDSLQQEQPEDVVVVAKTFLNALSKTPYNNKPITDAQIIVKQLLLFFENPKEYNPDAILEQPEVDLENEIDLEWKKCKPTDEGMGLESANIVNEQFDYIARHFYELGKLNARKL